MSSSILLLQCLEAIRFLSREHLVELQRKLLDEVDCRLREDNIKRHTNSQLPHAGRLRTNRPGDLGGSFL